jgi:ERF superfamily protein
MNVYECIAAVSDEIAKTGISKDRKNQQQGYSFRGIDDVYNALAPMLAKHKLVILPRILSRSVTERETQKGGVLFNVVVEAEFDFVSARDGSKHTARTYGEAMDSADKATNKAMSAAYKYAAFQSFCIPTEGENDADATTPPEVKAAQKPQANGDDYGQRSYATNQAYATFTADLMVAAEKGTAALMSVFNKANPELRHHITRHDKSAWAAMQATAAKKRDAVPA